MPFSEISGRCFVSAVRCADAGRHGLGLHVANLRPGAPQRTPSSVRTASLIRRSRLSGKPYADEAGAALLVLKYAIGVWDSHMRFVETPVFTAALERHVDDEQYRRLKIALMLRPNRGPSFEVPVAFEKCEGRKAGAGQRGGLRVIYYCRPWVTGGLTESAIEALRGSEFWPALLCGSPVPVHTTTTVNSSSRILADSMRSNKCLQPSASYATMRPPLLKRDR